MNKTVTIELDTGTLRLDVEPGHIPLQRLLGFAARVSSKRKFLLVSKVLGKHYPVSPKLMSWSYRALARTVIKAGIGSSSLWIGMAETATGLGYGVFEAACQEGAANTLFLQTTRYHLQDKARLEFEEAHSHATDFFLYYPVQADYRKQFLSAETLVLIDLFKNIHFMFPGQGMSCNEPGQSPTDNRDPHNKYSIVFFRAK